MSRKRRSNPGRTSPTTLTGRTAHGTARDPGRRGRIEDQSVAAPSRAGLFEAWSGARTAALALGIVASLLLLWVPLGSPRAGAFSDSIEYIILAQQVRDLFAGGDQTLLLHTRLPAGFSAWLALASVDVAHAARAFWMTWLAFAWALIAMSLWIGRELPGRAAPVVVALTLAVPGFFLIAQNPVSESLFAALIGTALLGQTRPGVATSGLSRWVGAVAAALLPLVRTAGLPLTLAYAAWHWSVRDRSRPGRATLDALAVLAPGIIWHGWRATLPIKSGYSSSFSVDQLRERFGSIGDFFSIQALAIPEAVARLLDPMPGAATWILAVFVLALGAVGWWHRWRARKLDAWILPPALGILQIWPWPNEYPRMLWPVLPLLAVCVWQGIVAMRERRPQLIRTFTPVFASLLAACLVAAWLPLAQRMALPVPQADRPFQRQAAYLLAETPQQAARIAAASSALDKVIRALPAHVEPSDCVYAIAAEAVWLNSGGRVLVRHFEQRIDVRAPLPPQLTGCRYVLAAQLTSPQFPQLPSLFPLAVSDSWADVVLLSEFAVGTERQTAAALLRQREWPAVVPTRISGPLRK